MGFKKNSTMGFSGTLNMLNQNSTTGNVSLSSSTSCVHFDSTPVCLETCHDLAVMIVSNLLVYADFKRT